MVCTVLGRLGDVDNFLEVNLPDVNLPDVNLPDVVRADERDHYEHPMGAGRWSEVTVKPADHVEPTDDVGPADHR